MSAIYQQLHVFQHLFPLRVHLIVYMVSNGQMLCKKVPKVFFFESQKKKENKREEYFFLNFILNFVVMTKVYPSFGMTTTQDLRDLFA